MPRQWLKKSGMEGDTYNLFCEKMLAPHICIKHSLYGRSIVSSNLSNVSIDLDQQWRGDKPLVPRGEWKCG